MWDRRTVLANFDALTAEEKENVPHDSYLRAKADLSRGNMQLPAPQPLAANNNAPVAPAPQAAEAHPRVLGQRDPNQGN